MAQRPDGKPAATERVVFTRPAADRIARVVRTVEGGDRTSKALTFESSLSASPSAIKLARYTATTSWVKGTIKPVVFVTANTSAIAFSGITATAINRFAIIPGHTGSGTVTTEGVLLSLQKVGGIWTVMNAES